MGNKIKTKEDLNRKILRNSRTRRFAQKALFSRTIMAFAAFGVQLFILLFFLFELNTKIEYYLAVSIVMSTGFLIYIVNSKGKNEYKIAWLVPVVLFPIIGISCYWLFHNDLLARKLKKDIAEINNNIVESHKQKENPLAVVDGTEYENIAHYLYNEGHFCPHTDSSVKYFPNGETFFPDFLESLRSAKKYIFIEFFIITIDECWEQVVEILEQKVKEGVEVRVICDGVGTYMLTGKAYQRYLHSKGIKSKVFNPLKILFSTPVNNRDHRKIVIVDGKVAYTGGVNLSNQYFNVGKNRFPYWKDNAVRIQGPAVQNLLQLFFEIWNIGEKNKDNYSAFLDAPVENQPKDGIVIPYGDDAFNNEDIAENLYIDIISNAKKYVYITTPYVVIDNQFLSVLIFAAKKGVDVRIVVPSKPDHLATFCVGKTYLKDLVDNGVKVYLYEKGFIHAKTFLSDDKIATVGSVNLDYRSLYAHFECGALLCENSAIPEIKADFNSMFETDCVEMKQEDYKKIPAYQRMIGRVGRIIGPLM